MDPDPRKEIEVDPDPDPDLDPERGLKWIRIRPNAVDPGGSGSGSETLVERTSYNRGSFFILTVDSFDFTEFILNLILTIIFS